MMSETSTTLWRYAASLSSLLSLSCYEETCSPKRQVPFTIPLFQVGDVATAIAGKLQTMHLSGDVFCFESAFDRLMCSDFSARRHRMEYPIACGDMPTRFHGLPVFRVRVGVALLLATINT